MNVRQIDATQPGGCIGSFSSSGFEFLRPNLVFNRFVVDAFFYPERAADPANLPAGTTLPDPAPGGVYRWTLGESTTRSRLLYQAYYPSTGQTRQAAQRFILLGDPAVEPNVGSPSLSVAINGLPVEDPEDGYFLDPASSPGPLTVTVTATDGRGLAAMRVVDSGRGEIPASDYRVDVEDQTADGVVLTQTLTYTFEPRSEEYEIAFQAVDGAGVTSSFRITVTTEFQFTGGEPAVYPNPFPSPGASAGNSGTYLVYKLTRRAESVKVSVFTVTGRRIREFHEGSREANRQHRVYWDGRDDLGNEVANGTYFFYFQVFGDEGELQRTVPVAKMR
jgi:hypothetical protein